MLPAASFRPRRASHLCLLNAALLSSLYSPLISRSCPAQVSDAPASAPTAKKPLTFEAVYGPDAVNFGGRMGAGITWLPEGQRYQQNLQGKPMSIDARTGTAEPAFDVDALAAALSKHPDFTADEARATAARPGEFSKDRQRVLITQHDQLFIYDFSRQALKKLGKEPEKRREIDLSPKGAYVSYVQDGDLHLIDARSGGRRRLTSSGSETVLNGILDWVYQEEVYGRGDYRAYWWRDDEKFLAFLQLDETGVPKYKLIDSVPRPPAENIEFFPKPGDPNPRARLGVVRIGGLGGTRWIDLSKYAGVEPIIARVEWAPDGRLIFLVTDRQQRWLDLNDADPQTGRIRTLLREVSPAWVDVLDTPRWLKDGSFLWLSERDGWRHIYHYDRDGRLIRRLTEGPWEVRKLHGVDADKGLVYFSGTRDTVIEDHGYRMPLAGGAIERITEPGFNHSLNFDPQCQMFSDAYSNVNTPPASALRNADGSLVRMLSENKSTALDEYQLGRTEFVRWTARDGYALQGLLILPPDYQPGRKYPVLNWVYAGPGAQTVKNRWGGRELIFSHLLAQEGVVVWHSDPRSGSGQGAIAQWTAYRRLGEAELPDLEDGIKYLIDRGIADPSRVAMAGWSYGGFMTAYALTHSQVFSAGVAVASVTDWRNYDTIYTERFMQTLEDNKEGYERTSVVNAAKNLHGRLLLIHGTQDDNVHFQNAEQLVFELNKAGKQFDLMIYPRDEHGISNGYSHLMRLRYDFLREHLLGVGR